MSETTKNSATNIIAQSTPKSKTDTQPESKLTLYDFKKYLESRFVKRVIYSSENQSYYNPECYSPEYPLKFELQFDGILVSTAPYMECVYLGLLPHNNNSNMIINYVRYVRIEYSILGDVVHLYCSTDRKGKGKTQRFTLLIQYE